MTCSESVTTHRCTGDVGRVEAHDRPYDALRYIGAADPLLSTNLARVVRLRECRQIRRYFETRHATKENSSYHAARDRFPRSQREVWDSASLRKGSSRGAARPSTARSRTLGRCAPAGSMVFLPRTMPTLESCPPPPPPPIRRSHWKRYARGRLQPPPLGQPDVRHRVGSAFDGREPAHPASLALLHEERGHAPAMDSSAAGQQNREPDRSAGTFA